MDWHSLPPFLDSYVSFSDREADRLGGFKEVYITNYDIRIPLYTCGILCKQCNIGILVTFEHFGVSGSLCFSKPIVL